MWAAELHVHADQPQWLMLTSGVERDELVSAHPVLVVVS